MGRDPYEDDDVAQPGIHPAGQEDEDESTSEQLRGDVQSEQDYSGDRDEGAENEPSGIDEDPSQGQVRRRSRDENMAGLREVARAERERADRIEREVAELRRQQQGQADRQFQQTEQERLALMPLEQQVEYRLERDRQQNQLIIQRMQFEQALLNDKISYQSTADEQRKRLLPEVERLQQQEMQQGRYWTREQIYRFVRGNEAVEQEAARKTRVQTPGAQRQRVAAPNSRSDQSARPRGGRPRTLEEREEELSKYRF